MTILYILLPIYLLSALFIITVAYLDRKNFEEQLGHIPYSGEMLRKVILMPVINTVIACLLAKQLLQIGYRALSDLLFGLRLLWLHHRLKKAKSSKQVIKIARKILDIAKKDNDRIERRMQN